MLPFSDVPLTLDDPATKAEVIASAARDPRSVRPRILSQVVRALAICKSCTIRSITTHTNCRAAHTVRTTVKGSRKMTSQIASAMMLHLAWGGDGRFSRSDLFSSLQMRKLGQIVRTIGDETDE